MQLRILGLLAGISFGVAALASPPQAIVGNVRIQFLAEGLVRLEKKGPEGFENRKTFTVVGRDWKGVRFAKLVQGGNVLFKTPRYLVDVPSDAQDITGIKLESPDGTVIYTVGALPGQSFLPPPTAPAAVYPVADSPRMVPPPQGPVPASLHHEHPDTSGFDTGDDAPDLYLFVPSKYEELRTDYLHLTGPVPLVPRFAMGFIDSRYYPYTEAEALASIDAYHERGIPVDLFVVDTDWRLGGSDGYKADPKYFPDMPRFLKEAHGKGVRIMFNDHPEPQYPTALDPRETEFRWNGMTQLMGEGVDVWWFDRNWSTVLHEPMPGISKEVWGASLYHDVTQAFRPDQRPLIMTNAEGIDGGFRNGPPHPADHRYPIWWTGDTPAVFGSLKRAVANSVDCGVLSEMPYVHDDLGGHYQTPTPELYVRYLQFGSVCPIMRVHCTRGEDRHPWAFGPEAEDLATQAIHFRYKLLPTLYSAARETFDTGLPILRRLDLFDPNTPADLLSNEYELGDSLLVAPVIDSELGDFKPLDDLMHSSDGQAGLSGEYFTNQNLTGSPTVTRVDPKLDFEWDEGPAPGVPHDNFSVRWTGTLGPVPMTGEYTFGLTSDDGSRMFIDDQKVVDSWKDQVETTTTGKIQLEAGKTYRIRVEYYQVGGEAVCRLGWRLPGVPHKGTKRDVFVPAGNWTDLWTGAPVAGGQRLNLEETLGQMPLYVKDGSILFLGDDSVTADQQLAKPMTAEIFASRSTPSGTARLYEDDGISNDYQKGAFAQREVSYKWGPVGRLEIEIEPSKGSFRGMPEERDWKIRVHLPSGMTAVGASTGKLKVETAGGPATGLKDLFQARGGAVAEIDLAGLKTSDSARIDLKLSGG